MAEFIVTSAADDLDGPLNAADGLTLRGAIMLAEAAAGADTIRFAPDVTRVRIERDPASPASRVTHAPLSPATRSPPATG